MVILKKFNLDNVNNNSINIIIGKRYTTKTIFVRELIKNYNKRKLKNSISLVFYRSLCEEYKDLINDKYIYNGFENPLDIRLFLKKYIVLKNIY